MSLLFGILSIVLAFFCGALFGVVGGGIALVLGVLAIVFSRKVKKDPNRGNGTGGFVTGIIGTIFGCLVIAIFLLAPSELKREAKEKGLTNLEKVLDGFTFGVVGMMNEADKQGIDMNIISDEFDMLK